MRLAEIAQRADMSSGQLMYYFPSKERILLETLAWQERKDTANRRAVLPDVTGAWNQLELFADLYFPSGPTDASWILWSEAWARAPHNPEVAAFLSDLVYPWGEDLDEIVRGGVRDGAFVLRMPARDFAMCFTAMLDGLAIVYLNEKPGTPRESMIGLAMASARVQLAPAAGP